MVCIPEEIVEEILLNLPVKAVLRLRCVSKSWRSLTGSKRFIKSHLQNSEKEAVIMYLVGLHNRAKYELKSVFEKEQVRHMTAPPLPPQVGNRVPYIMGCSNGLVCLNLGRPHLNVGGEHISTRTFEELPRIKNVHRIGNVGFGWEESREEYKVFALVMEDSFLPPLIGGRVYSSKTNSWKKLELEHEQFNFESLSAMQLVCGKLHWIYTAGWVCRRIGWFDLKSEMFGVIELPTDRPYMRELGMVGGCLCCIKDSNMDAPIPDSIEVWVMKEYGVRESWAQLTAVDHPFSASSINVSSSGEIMLFLSSTLVIYSPSRNLFRRASEFGFCDHIACLHMQSLVSPKPFIQDGN